MCELFAFSGDHPALLRYSMHEFARHGADGHNAEGWGVAHYQDGDVRLIKEPSAARDSACLEFIEHHPLRSSWVMSHIRHATQGVAALRNCQPFVRELGGSMHVFAHNGHLDRDSLSAMVRPAGFRPVGETDSELAFCGLLERLRPLWASAADGAPDLDARLDTVAGFAAELRSLGPANFIYADGDVLFAHGHRRTQRDGAIRPPGLHLLCRACEGGSAPFHAGGLQISAGDPEGPQVMIASVPLTDDPGWRPLGEGELLVVRSGLLLR